MNKDVSLIEPLKKIESPYIKEIHDLSEDHSEIERHLKMLGFEDSLSMARMRIIFHNDFQMSVIRGNHSFGGKQGLFEIAIFHPVTGMHDVYFDECDKGDIVVGHCTIERVQYYIDKIGKMINTNLVPIETELVELQK